MTVNTVTTATIAPLLIESEHAVDICVLFALLWVATCDGPLRPQERQFITDKLAIDDSVVSIDTLLSIITSRQQESFEAVFAVLMRMSEKEKEFLLELAVGVTAAVNSLSNAEHYALSFLADLVGGGALKLKLVYKVVTDNDIPSQGDPSSVSWWREQEGGHRRTADGEVDKSTMNRSEALLLLGLTSGASPEEIKKAYKRRLQHFHPDRFETKGGDAKYAAQLAFVRVQQAYETLKP